MDDDDQHDNARDDLDLTMPDWGLSGRCRIHLPTKDFVEIMQPSATETIAFK